MELAQVAASLRAFVVQTFEIDENDNTFDNDIHLFDYGYVDSFGATRIVSFVESEFSVTIAMEDLIIHPLNTVNEIATLVHSRLEEN